MRLKGDTVALQSLVPQVVLALWMANEVYNGHGIDMVLTSGSDSRHSNTSLHYSGQAVDLRTNNIPTEPLKGTIAREIKKKLNVDYDVVLESDHIHLEYQPRMPR